MGMNSTVYITRSKIQYILFIYALRSPTERVRGTADNIEQLLPHGLEGRVARQFDHEHAGLYAYQLHIRVHLVTLVVRRNLHGVGRGRAGSGGSTHQR